MSLSEKQRSLFRKYQLPPAISANKPQVVGTVHTMDGLRIAANLPAGALDYVEIRMDALIEQECEVLAKLDAIPFPLVCTVRDPREGGVNDLSLSRRRSAYEHLITYATFIDIELRSFPKMPELIDLAHENGVGVIASFHDFKSTPSPARLKSLYSSARWSGADIFKVAATTRTAAQFATMLDFVAARSKLPLAAMGMGPFGKVSRLTLATAGSVLNYGYLDKSAASGQWPAELLKERLAELQP